MKNPEFYYSPDYWYCIPGSYLDCYWLRGDTGSIGGVTEIYGAIDSLSSDTAYILQEVVVPDSPIESAYLYVTVRFTSTVILTYWFAGIYDPSTNTSYYASFTTTPSTYTTYVIDLTNYVEPGKNYYVFVGVYGFSLLGGDLDFRIDSVYFDITTQYYTFSNSILDLNATSASAPIAYARLVVDSATTDPGLNATIYLVNASLYRSTSITIVNGVLGSSATSWVKIGPTVSGYSAAYIRLNVSKRALGDSTINMYLEICSGAQPGTGACSYYPVSVLIDPPSRSKSLQNAPRQYSYPRIITRQGIPGHSIVSQPITLIHRATG